jgi:molecular chaperone GrpE (heat shock protein)
MSSKEEKNQKTDTECCEDCECKCENESCKDCECSKEDCEKDIDNGECGKLKTDLAQEKGERLALLAEFINYKKRAESDKAEFIVYANNSLLKQIIEIIWSIYPKLIKEKFYLFIDEPQAIDNWELAIRGIHDE